MHVTTCRSQQKQSLTTTVQQYIIYTNCRGLQIPGTKMTYCDRHKCAIVFCHGKLIKSEYQVTMLKKSRLNIILSAWVVNSVLLK